MAYLLHVPVVQQRVERIDVFEQRGWGGGIRWWCWCVGGGGV